MVIAIQCLIAVLPARKVDTGVDLDKPRGRVAVLVPAYNEATGIERTLRQIMDCLRSGDRCVVVADNCSDDTATRAASAGAVVLERHDQQNRGKGFALDAGIRLLESDPPDVVIVIDADCDVEPDSIEYLTRAVEVSDRPIQASNLVRAPAGGGPEASVSVFAFLVKNWVRARAMHRLGLPVLLTGTGMAFPWHLIRDAKLGSSELVEDLALGLSLTRQGHGPMFCERAQIFSDLPSDPDAAIEQRTRWEHGYLGSILREVPPLLLDGICGFRPILIAVAINLAVPPLALLALSSMLAWALVLGISFWTNHWLSLLVFTTIGGLAVAGLSIVFVMFGRTEASFATLWSIPLYVWHKLGIYQRFVGKRQTEWVRTARDADAKHE